MIDTRCYGCGTRHRGGDHVCDNPIRSRRTDLEDRFLRDVRETLLADETTRWVENEITRRLSKPKGDAKDANRRLADVDSELQRVADAIAQVGLSPTLQARLVELEGRGEAVCRHPDAYRLAIAMSGTFDLLKYLNGHMTQDFYFSSPLHFLPGLEGPQLELLRRQFILIPCGEGRWEDIGESWRLADVLGRKGIPNRVDSWGPAWDHDWPTWPEMLPRYLAEFA